MKKILFFLSFLLTFTGSINVFADDIPTGLVRLKNRRTTTSYLTTTTSGAASGASKASSGFSQIWICMQSGEGFTLRSGQTGEYLQEDFAKPANGATTLYIQASPNADGYYNISSSSSFSGNSCLNLGNDGATLYKWSYKGDAGSDWTIEVASDVTEDEVRENLKKQTGMVGELSEGKYYRLISSYGLALTEAEALGDDIKTEEIDPANIAQYWTLRKNGDYWQIRNVLTERSILRQTTTSAPYHTTTDASATTYNLKIDFDVTLIQNDWDYKWTIAYPGDSQGFHDASSQGHLMVLWSTNADASIWSFQEAEVSEEAIEAARKKFQEFEESVQLFKELRAQKTALQTALNALFEDKACTTLKDDIATLSDDELAANESYAALTDDMKAMVLKVKNDTWKQYTNKQTGYTAGYEKFFRVADYHVYSNHQDMANSSNFTMSNAFGRLSGPTGIVANKGDIIYIYVDQNANSKCSLQLEAVSTDGVPGSHSTGTQTPLKAGLNLFQYTEQKMLYIFYQLTPTTGIYSRLDRYPDIKIHIEGGQLNGYWDATRGMTNADWALLQQDLLKASPSLNLKTKHLVFCMDADLVKQAEPKEMEGLMRIWDRIPENEERYMGVEDFEGRFNNIWNVFSVDYNYMFAGGYGTYYNNSTLGTIMNYENMRAVGSLWGPSHEIGHNHQASINVVGTTESSNNMFSNINRFEQGIQTTRRQLPPDNFYELTKGTTWVKRSIWNTTSMFFQLYLYFHVQHHDDQFLPNLFRALRKNPITKVSGWDSTTQFEDGGETKTGANITYGKYDYLHLAKTICDVAQADLSEFFESYGMFVPADKVFVGDYANYLVTTTQADIDAAKAYMKKYPKKLGNIMFIDDHVVDHEAVADNIFEGIVPANGLRVNDLGQHNELGNGFPVGDVGDYESYDGHEEYDVDNDLFMISSNKISFRGTDYIGHKFYDLDGNLIWATNAKSTTMPASIQKMDPSQYVVVAAQQNMTDVPCPYFKRGEYPTYAINVSFGSEGSDRKWFANSLTKLDKYMPENAVGVVGSANAPENIVGATNIINADNTAKSIVINGDKPWYLPADVTATSVAFTKSAEGYAALNLPFDVNSSNLTDLKTATYNDETLELKEATSVEAGQPVVVNGNVSLALENVTMKAGSFQPLSAVYVLAADGANLEAVESASPFTYSFKEATAIRNIASDKSAASEAPVVYDLTGRRTNHLTHGIYIINGKKVVIK